VSQEGQTGRSAAHRYRVATVPYAGSLPLVEGLDDHREVELLSGAPSHLGEMLVNNQADVAQLPCIELQRLGTPVQVVPAGGISSIGPTLTVRVFSNVPAEELELLWADASACSSVALARMLWAENYRRRLTVIPFEPIRQKPAEDAQGILLIGDKVVASPPLGYEWQFDLGAMWFELTGLPFVFTVWAARLDTDCDRIYQILLAARRLGQQRLERIAREYAPVHGWPDDLAIRHLTKSTRFEFDDAQREGMEEFFERAEDFGIIEKSQPVRFYRPQGESEAGQ